MKIRRKNNNLYASIAQVAFHGEFWIFAKLKVSEIS